LASGQELGGSSQISERHPVLLDTLRFRQIFHWHVIRDSATEYKFEMRRPILLCGSEPGWEISLACCQELGATLQISSRRPVLLDAQR